MRILLAGGGTGGSVSPILAVAEGIKKLSAKGGSAFGGKFKTEFLFVGTKSGPEKKLVESAGIAFITIPSAKLRRYFSLWNFVDFFIFITGLFKAIFIIKKFRPDAIFGVGSFAQVPLIWAGRFFRIKIIIHQQDARIGLANKLSSPFADKITTAFEQTSKNFYSGSGIFTKKWKPAAEWVGNPVRAEIFNKHDYENYFKLHERLPILLILGGATGSEQINNLVAERLSWLVKNFQIIHQIGSNKNKFSSSTPDYHPFELIPWPQYPYILQKADIVVCRSGLSTITELSVLGKVAIVIPMPKTHQEENASILVEANAAIVLFREEANANNLLNILHKLRFDFSIQQMLKKNIKTLFPIDSAKKLAEIIIKTVNG